jgi:Rrf2 family protein
MFSKACEYAIRAVLYIAYKSIDGSRSSIKEIANEINSPEPFTAKILQSLTKAEIISSIKGPNGGFFLEPTAKPVPLVAIVKVIDDENVLHSCALGLKQCSNEFPCPIHHEIKAYKDRLLEVMSEKTVQQLAKELDQGQTFLKNHSAPF